MSKFKSSVIIIGVLLMCVISALITFLALAAAGMLEEEPIALVFSVDNAQKYYDGTPLEVQGCKLTEGELLAGHTATAEPIGSITEVGMATGDLSVKVYDENGYDVTSQYSIQIKTGVLAVLPCPLMVQGNDMSITYTGKPVSYDGFSVLSGELAYGHRLVAGANSGLVNVGDRLSESFQPRVVDAVGTDVTRNYAITFQAGNVNVVPRLLVLRPVSVSKVYDGTPLTCTNYEIVSGSLAEGEFLRINSYSAEDKRAAVLTDVGTMQTQIAEAKVLTLSGGREIDVSGNYNLLSEYGSLTVTKRPLSVVGLSGTFTYDGTEKSFSDQTEPAVVTGLAGGESLSLTYSGSLTDAGTAPNMIAAWDIIGGDKENYEVTAVNGTITVERAPLTVYLKNLYKTYDGEAFDEKDLVSSPQLPKGYTYDCTAEDLSEYIVPCTKSYSAVVKVMRDGKDCSDNYLLTVVEGTVNIAKKDASYAFGSAVKQYDGEPLSANGTPEGFLAGHTVTESGATQAVDAGSYLNSGTVKVSAGGKDVTDCYNIAYSYGSLTVTKRPITFEPISKKYGEQISQTDVIPLDIPVDVGKSTDYDFSKKLNAGSHLLEIGMKFTKGEADVSHNFEVGKLNVTITPAQLVFTDYEGVKTKTYDGKPFVLDCGQLKFEGSDTLKVQSVGFEQEVIRAGEDQQLTVTSAVLFDTVTGENVTANYRISPYLLSVTVEKRKLILITDSISVSMLVLNDLSEEEKTELLKDTVRFGEGAVAEGDALALNWLDCLEAISNDELWSMGGKIAVTIKEGAALFVNAEGESTMDNYDLENIGYRYGLLSIIIPSYS